MGKSGERIRQWGEIFGRPLTYRLLAQGRLRRPPSVQQAIRKSLDWLLVAHRAGGDQGFASHLSLSSGWGPPYPETSGYLVPTLLAMDSMGYRRAELKEAVDRTGQWLLSIQLPEGAFDAPATHAPMVFDTGQVLFGLLALSRGDGEGAFLAAARKAGEWILSEQSPDGSWVRSAYRGIPHTYYSRVAWALLCLAEATGENRFRAAAHKQLRWVLSRQDQDGFFSQCSFSQDERPVLHVIAYTIEGLWEAALGLGDAELERAASKAAEALAARERGEGSLASHFGPGWQPEGKGICVTGLCQISRVWLRMAERYIRPDLGAAARRCLDFVLRRQVDLPAFPEVHGALPGSIPLWGEYFPWAFPNWGTKFLIDALLLQEGLDRGTRPPG